MQTSAVRPFADLHNLRLVDAVRVLSGSKFHYLGYGRVAVTSWSVVAPGRIERSTQIEVTQ